VCVCQDEKNNKLVMNSAEKGNGVNGVL